MNSCSSQPSLRSQTGNGSGFPPNTRLLIRLPRMAQIQHSVHQLGPEFRVPWYQAREEPNGGYEGKRRSRNLNGIHWQIANLTVVPALLPVTPDEAIACILGFARGAYQACG